MKSLNEHRKYINELLTMSLWIFTFGGFMMIPFNFWSKDVHETAFIFFGIGTVLGLITLFNIYLYNKNKKKYNKLKK